VRRVALVGLFVSSLAAACGFPGVTFMDAGTGDGTTAESDATSGEGGVGVDGTTGADSPGSEDAGGDAATDASSPDAADARAPQDSGQDVGASDGSRMDATADGPNCNCGAGSMLPTNLTCPSVLGLNCKGSGFSGSGPICGSEAHYFTCVAGTLQCMMQDDGLKVQECQ
jgi:hypothetical protein